MNEHPLLFTGEMVRAILDDRKTQTRRVPVGRYLKWKVGDMIWVRESILLKREQKTPYYDTLYCADNTHLDGLHELDNWFESYNSWYASSKNKQIIPSIHMRKEAARIFLEITGLRDERVQDISWEDVEKEGLRILGNTSRRRLFFKELWNSINAKRHNGIYAWRKSPVVKVIEFKRIEDGKHPKNRFR